MKQIKYKGGYKYQLTEKHYTPLGFRLPVDVDTSYMSTLNSGRTLLIGAGYAWDGTSGPVIDTKENMRGSLVHDALYQLLREEVLPPSYRQPADAEFRRICIEDGVSAWRAWMWYVALRWGGNPAADPMNAKAVTSAP